MSISDQIIRLNNAKAAIKQSIKNKGVTVSDSALLDEYPALIDSIEVGSGGGDSVDPYYETLWNYITNNNTDYSYLFYGYKGKTLDISNLDTSNVTDMRYMFYCCFQLTELDLSNFDTSNVTDMNNMFYSCYKLTTLDLSNFNTSNVTNMSDMFYGCNLLTSLDVSNLDTSNVTDMTRMFYYCDSLTTLDLSNFDTSNVTSMTYMFNNCKSLTSLDLSNFNTSNVTSMSNMFTYCNKLTSLDMSNCDVSKCTSSSSINTIIGTSSYSCCPNLTDFKAPKNINANLTVSYSPLLTHDSLMSIINNLKTVTSTNTLTLGTTNLAKLSSEEVAIATNKGWTVK